MGIEYEGRVILGGDSEASGGGRSTRADAKVFVTPHYAIGFTDSYRMGQILRYTTDLPTPPQDCNGIEVDAFMVAEFVEAARAAFVAAGFTKIENERHEGGTFLVGVRGRLYTVYSDFQIAHNKLPYAAIGGGGSIALGAMHAMHRLADSCGFPPRSILGAGLRAAEEWAEGVRGPFKFVELAA